MVFEAVDAVDALLRRALRDRASDVHVEPVASGCELRLRVDGELQAIQTLSAEDGRAVALRLMVLAKLLTYRLDIPQEGRCAFVHEGKSVDLRISIMPTARGLRAVVRLPAELIQPRSLEALGLPAEVLAALDSYVHAPAGMLIVCGPAGSGKTTALYALLERIAEQSRGASIIAIEDPVERALNGVTQIEVSSFGDLTFERALRSVLRQDPQVLMVGEIRDATTAAIAVNAAMSGHRLLCTLHAADCAGAILRLIEMGIEPYKIAGSLWGVLNLRLVRKGVGGTYQGRTPLAEFARLDEKLRSALTSGAHVAAMRSAIAGQRGWVPMRQSAQAMVQQGLTDAGEIDRVLGPQETDE